MRRIDRRRIERIRRGALIVGLSFALGALADTALTWRLHEFEGPSADTGRASMTGRASSAPTAEESSRGVGAEIARPAGTTGSASPRELLDRDLQIPVEGITPAELHDTFTDARALGRPHEAIDIMAPKGTRVFAVEDGAVSKLFRSVAGGLTIYQFDPTGEYAYYYAHLDSYAKGLREGQIIRRGQTIGYVGSTGNASAAAPHLHFSIYRLGPEHKWWKGDAINPYPLLK